MVDRLGYDERITMDVKAGLVARLDQLRSGGGKGPMFDTRVSIPTEVLFGSPCILELKQLVDDDEKAFVIGLILIRLYEYYEGGQGRSVPARDGLRHVTLIEEAHRLLRNVSTEQGSEVAANPKGRAIEVFANILSEIRAYGEGFLIAEQVPVKLVPDALKNTNLKVVHRLVAEDDRKAVGGTMNLGEVAVAVADDAAGGPGRGLRRGDAEAGAVAGPARRREAGGPRRDESTRSAIRRTSERSGRRMRRLCACRFAACKACRGSVAGASCAEPDGRRHRRVACGPPSAGCSRPSGSIRAGARALFEDYRAHCLAHPAAIREPGLTYCLFVELVEAEAERRGTAWGWSHRTVETVVTLACELAARLVALPAGSPDETLPNGLTDIQEEFATLVVGIHKSGHLPFAGCMVCRHRCLFRYDMALHPRSDAVSAFIEAVQDDSAGDEDVVHICEHAARDRLAIRDPDKTNGAALCFAVQQFGAMGMPLHDQRTFSSAWRTCL